MGAQNQMDSVIYLHHTSRISHKTNRRSKIDVHAHNLLYTALNDVVIRCLMVPPVTCARLVPTGA